MTRPSWLAELLRRGVVAYSRVRSAQARQDLQTLQALRLVRVRPESSAAHGSRRVVEALAPKQVAQWIDSTYPVVEDNHASTLPQRGQNIAFNRNSKAGETTHTVQPILFKWFTTAPESELADLTKTYGLVGVCTDLIKALALPACWTLLTVENWESFYTLALPSPTLPVMVLYLGGNVPQVVLTALSEMTPLPWRVIHFGDYDWAGLAIFQRIGVVFPQAQLYQPSDLESLFERYGDRELIERQSARVLDLDDARCTRVIACITRYNAGLEQEIVPFNLPEAVSIPEGEAEGDK